jgi:hypothetical protein
VHQGNNHNVITEAELRQMDPAQRQELARMLAGIDYPHPLLDLTFDRRRKLGTLLLVLGCVILAAWIVVLVLTLHRHFTATHWRLAWVGFDVFELAGFAITAWAFWRGRQIVIASLMVTGTLLCCDAWFDVILDLGTSGVWLSITSAVFVELPLAFLMLNAARRLIRMSALAAVGAGGIRAPMPSLWKLPLAGLHNFGSHPGPEHSRHGDPGQDDPGQETPGGGNDPGGAGGSSHPGHEARTG